MNARRLSLLAGAVLLILLLTFPREIGREEASTTMSTSNLAHTNDSSFSPEEQRYLLALARETSEAAVSGRPLPAVDETSLSPFLKEIRGCFVTLNKYNMLRGCVGHILPQVPLYRCVIENAVAASLYDRRFRPVSADELDDIMFEVSVLSVPEPLYYDSPEDLLAKITPGVDGVVLKYDGRSSTYLPTVWEDLPGKREFLSKLCLKQGSPPDCWRRGAQVEVYHTEEFHET